MKRFNSFYKEQVVSEGRIGKFLSTAALGASLLGSNIEATDTSAYFKHFSQVEGVSSKAYKDPTTSGAVHKSIGIGHLLTPSDRDLFERLFNGQVDYNDIISGRASLTKQQIEKLFQHDLQFYISRAKAIFPKFDSYPQSIQIAIVDGVFRGDLSGSPKTIGLIKAGRWSEAATEYLRNNEYLAAKAKGSGVAKRMKRNALAFRSYSK